MSYLQPMLYSKIVYAILKLFCKSKTTLINTWARLGWQIAIANELNSLYLNFLEH